VSAHGEAARIVVIGSGPSGAMAAHELTRLGTHVMLLEAGLKPPDGLIVKVAGHVLLRWRTGGQLLEDRHVSLGDPQTEWFSSMSPGGLSNYWTAAVPRFAPEDFTDGGRIDERFVWPLTYPELEPYYELAEEVLSISGSTRSLPTLPAGVVRYPSEMPSGWRAVAEASGADRFTVMPLARGGRWIVARRGSEFNSYHVIVKPLETASTFELRLGARVTRIIVDLAVRAATGVEYVDAATGVLSVMRCDAVVLAAGAIDSARILLSSKSPSTDQGLGNDNGVVGRYLHDHPREWWVADFEKPLPLVAHPIYLARQPYAGSQPLRGSSATIGRASTWQRPMEWAHRPGNRFGVQIFGTMIPDEAVGVELLAADARSSAHPRVGLRIRYSDADVATLSAAQANFQSIFADAGYPVKVMPEAWMPRPGSSVHFAGCVRMHENPAFGVLDRWGAIHGTPNVVVADLGAFTTNPEKNPTLTSMALAARAVRHLAEGLR